MTTSPADTRRRPSWLRSASPFEIGGLAVLLVFLVLGVIGNWIAPYDPNALNVGPAKMTPTADFLLGTDALGRDQLSRILAAIRPTLLAAGFATTVALVLGVLLGLVGGFWGGRVDNLVSRIIDFLFAVPEYLLAILVLAILGRGLLNAGVAIGIVFIPRFARTVRSATQEVMSRSYISAAVLCGRSRWWIAVRHVIPNVTSPVVVLTAINLSMSAGTYAALSFLGFGVRPPEADFGSMISDALQYIAADPWLVVAPACVFVLFILSVNLVGDLVRDVLDPQSEQSG